MILHPYQTIDQVLHRLEEIISWARKNDSKVGIFGSIYRRTTVLVKQKLEQGNYFEDNERMNRLVILFAHRYFQALEQYQNGQKLTESWLVAFKAADDPDTSMLQNLLLSCNAHIGLDLGIVCHQIQHGKDLNQLSKDFKKVESLLLEVVVEVMSELSRLSMGFRILSAILFLDAPKGMMLMAKVRLIGWKLAERMNRNEQNLHHFLINSRDIKTSKWGKFFYQPGGLLQYWWRLMKRFEEPDVSLVMQTLA